MKRRNMQSAAAIAVGLATGLAVLLWLLLGAVTG